MGKMISELTGKLKTSSFRRKKTDEIITKENIEDQKFNKGESKENMTRNLGHARAANAATLSKRESRNASRRGDFTEKTDL